MSTGYSSISHFVRVLTRQSFELEYWNICQAVRESSRKMMRKELAESGAESLCREGPSSDETVWTGLNRYASGVEEGVSAI